MSVWNNKAVFLTLTYDDEHLPKDGNLQPSDLTKFWKRLRKNLNGRKISYFASAEYGDERLRPHFHAIVFGLDPFSQLDKGLVIDSWRYCQPNQFDLGAYEQVEVGSIMYVCGYVQKKLKDEKKYAKMNLVPPFQRVSNGIGFKGVKSNPTLLKQMLSNGSVAFNGLSVPIPSYYYKKFPELEFVKNDIKRKLFMQRIQDIKELDPTLTDEMLFHIGMNLGSLDSLYESLTVNARSQRDIDLLRGLKK